MRSPFFVDHLETVAEFSEIDAKCEGMLSSSCKTGKEPEKTKSKATVKRSNRKAAVSKQQNRKSKIKSKRRKRK